LSLLDGPTEIAVSLLEVPVFGLCSVHFADQFPALGLGVRLPPDQGVPATATPDSAPSHLSDISHLDRPTGFTSLFLDVPVFGVACLFPTDQFPALGLGIRLPPDQRVLATRATDGALSHIAGGHFLRSPTGVAVVLLGMSIFGTHTVHFANQFPALGLGIRLPPD